MSLNCVNASIAYLGWSSIKRKMLLFSALQQSLAIMLYRQQVQSTFTPASSSARAVASAVPLISAYFSVPLRDGNEFGDLVAVVYTSDSLQTC